jgi:hypothetical protein
MVIISDDRCVPTTNRRHHPAIRRAQGRSPRFVLCDYPGGAVFCLFFNKDEKTFNQDRIRRLTYHFNGTYCSQPFGNGQAPLFRLVKEDYRFEKGKRKISAFLSVQEHAGKSNFFRSHK